MTKAIDLKVSELRLDSGNPRIEPEAGQINIRQALIDDQGSKLGELAADIAKFGLNPMDRLMVLQPDTTKVEYISLEGNRRTSALQLLANPALMADLAMPDALRNRLQSLADNFDPGSVEPIAAVIMPSRESSRHWIELRHTGQNNGRGIVSWDGMQTGRFRGDKLVPLIDFVRQKGELNSEEKAALGSGFAITTLDRILSNPVARQKIGVQITDNEYQFLYPANEQLKILKKIIMDIAKKIVKVDKVETAALQIQYLDSLPMNCFPQGAKLAAPQSVTDILKGQTPLPPPPSPPPSPPPGPGPLDRKTLVPSTFNVPIGNQKAAHLLVELRGLNIAKFPVAGAVTLRCFIEAIVDIYCKDNFIATKATSGKGIGQPLTLGGKVEAVLEHLKTSLTPQELTAARLALTSKDSVISVNRLHEYVHNPAVFPVRSDLVSAWSGIEVYIKAVCK